MKGDDYEVVKVIGRGAFGEVQLVSVSGIVVIYAAVTFFFAYIYIYHHLLLGPILTII